MCNKYLSALFSFSPQHREMQEIQKELTLNWNVKPCEAQSGPRLCSCVSVYYGALTWQQREAVHCSAVTE